MTPTYNTQQQVFCLSMLSNSASSLKKPLEELQAIATQRITKTLADPQIIGLIGTWQLVWGPEVFSNAADPNQPQKPVVSDNLLYVAQRENSNDFVIATAGTNPISWFGWFVEDFSVRETVAWPFAQPPGLSPKIAKGTSVGLDILLAMKDQGVSLTNFLKATVAKTDVRCQLAVAGHSLGGALSAALALALVDTQAEWDSEGKAVISVLPSAGATPGDEDFARYYDQQLGLHTNRIWNSLDIVPHAWDRALLTQAGNLYTPFLTPNTLINGLVTLATSISAANNYTQLNAQTPGLASQVNLDSVFAPTPLSALVLDGLQTLVIGILKQHLSGVALTLAEAYVKEVIAKLKQEWQNGAQHVTETMLSVSPAELEDQMRQANAGINLNNLQASDLQADGHSFGDLGSFLHWLRSELSGMLSFLAQAGYQHVVVYFYMLGVEEYAWRSSQIDTELESET